MSVELSGKLFKHAEGNTYRYIRPSFLDSSVDYTGRLNPFGTARRHFGRE